MWNSRIGKSRGRSLSELWEEVSSLAAEAMPPTRPSSAGLFEVVTKLSSGDPGRTQVFSLTLSQFGIVHSVAQLYQV
jgi:hypothetical protein